jgi:hypothetical protein
MDRLRNGFRLRPSLARQHRNCARRRKRECRPQGNGDHVYLRTNWSGNPCDEWTITPASYNFASYAITTPDATEEVDNRGYSCAPTDQFRQSFVGNLNDWGGNMTATGPSYTNAGDSRVQF